MAKFLLTYHGGTTPETPEDQAAVMDAWGQWIGALGPAMVDIGNPVSQAKTVAPDGSVSDAGGPDLITGYSIISADDLDAAVEATKGCPILVAGGSVQVAETFDVM